MTFSLRTSLLLPAMTLLAFAAPSSVFAGRALDDLVRTFDRACIANAAIKPEFAQSRLEPAFKNSGSKTGLLIFWKPASRCQIQYYANVNVRRSAEADAKIKSVVVKFAKRVNGTVELRRKGKRNEYYKIVTPTETYQISYDYDRDGSISAVQISH